MPEANAEDAEEMRHLVEEIRRATAAHSQVSIEKAVASLEDLLFYLQDAG